MTDWCEKQQQVPGSMQMAITNTQLQDAEDPTAFWVQHKEDDFFPEAQMVMSIHWRGHWTRWPLKVLSNPNFLWFSCDPSCVMPSWLCFGMKTCHVFVFHQSHKIYLDFLRRFYLITYKSEKSFNIQYTKLSLIRNKKKKWVWGKLERQRHFSGMTLKLWPLW